MTASSPALAYLAGGFNESLGRFEFFSFASATLAATAHPCRATRFTSEDEAAAALWEHRGLIGEVYDSFQILSVRVPAAGGPVS